jgi:hypothetical protein
LQNLWLTGSKQINKNVIYYPEKFATSPFCNSCNFCPGSDGASPYPSLALPEPRPTRASPYPSLPPLRLLRIPARSTP